MDKRFISIAPINYKDEKIPTPKEIADIVYRAWNAGASIVHLHCIDKYVNNTPEVSLFTKTVNLIKEKCNIIIEGSTGGDSALSTEERSVVVGINGVEQASLNMGSVNLPGSVFVNSEESIRQIAERMNKFGVKPDLEIFNEAMIEFALELSDEGLLQDPLLFQMVFIENEDIYFKERKIGKLSQKQRRIIAELESIPAGCEVSICNQKCKDFSILTFAISLGLNIRVGFEDSKFISPDKLAMDNAELVEEVVKIMKCSGLEIADSDETRRILKIAK